MPNMNRNELINAPLFDELKQVIIPTLAIQNPKRVAIDGKLHRLSSYGKKSVSRHRRPTTMPIRNNAKYDFLLSFIFMAYYLHFLFHVWIFNIQYAGMAIRAIRIFAFICSLNFQIVFFTGGIYPLGVQSN